MCRSSHQDGKVLKTTDNSLTGGGILLPPVFSLSAQGLILRCLVKLLETGLSGMKGAAEANGGRRRKISCAVKLIFLHGADKGDATSCFFAIKERKSLPPISNQQLKR